MFSRLCQSAITISLLAFANARAFALTPLNNGHDLEAGRQYTIDWLSTRELVIGGVHTVSLELVNNATQQTTVIARDIPNMGGYKWTVPETFEISAPYFVRLTDNDYGSSIESPEFRILGSLTEQLEIRANNSTANSTFNATVTRSRYNVSSSIRYTSGNSSSSSTKTLVSNTTTSTRRPSYAGPTTTSLLASSSSSTSSRAASSTSSSSSRSKNNAPIFYPVSGIPIVLGAASYFLL